MSKARNQGVLAGGIVLVMVVLTGIIYTTRKTAGQAKSLSSSMIKVMLAHMQVVALARKFQLKWTGPSIALLESFDAVSSISDSVLSFDCVLTRGEASLFYAKNLLYLCSPLVLMPCVFLTWHVLVKPYWAYVAKRPMTSTQIHDAVIVSNVVIMVLLHPTLTRQAANIFTYELTESLCSTLVSKSIMTADEKSKFLNACFLMS